MNSKMPRCSFAATPGTTADRLFRRSYAEFKALGKDAMLAGIGSTEMGAVSDTSEFLQMCKALGVACNLWEYSQMAEAMWQAVRDATGVS